MFSMHMEYGYKSLWLSENTAGVLSSPGHLLGSEMYFQLHSPLLRLPLPEDSDFNCAEL